MHTNRPVILSLQARSGIEWITLLTSLTVLGGYIVWTLANEHNGVKEREHDRLSTQAQVIDTHVVEQLDAIRRVLINLRRELPSWTQHPGGMALANQRLKAFSDALTGVRTLGIFDASGTLIASNRSSLISRNFSKRHYFLNTRKLSDPDVLHVSPPFLSVNNKWVIVLSMSVLTQDGKFNGLVFAALDPDRFRSTLQSINYTTDMWSAIAHGGGLQFMMVPDRPGQAGKNLAQPGSFFTRHMESGKIMNFMTGKVYATGERRMMVLHTIQPQRLNMDKALVIAVGRDLDKVFVRWKQDAILRGALFLLVVLISAIALYLLQRAQRAAERNAAKAAIAIRKKNVELESLNEHLRSLAMIDGLTGIANRRRFDEVLDNEWRRSRRDHFPLALLMIDIDHFKDYNDNYGHQSGDDCLKQIAQFLKASFGRATDLIARYGGEEFACLMPETDLAGAHSKAESLRSKIASLNIRHEFSPTAPHVTISIGVAVCIPNDIDKPGKLISEADDALYRAKHQGRNRVCSADTL